jgi:hypothetical protein
MEYKNKDDFQLLNESQVPQSLERFIEELPERYSEGKIDKNIENQIDREWFEFQNRLNHNNSSFRKKMVSISLSFVAACGLFSIVAFSSPEIVQMASNIPYLNLIFENKINDKPLMQEITDSLYQNDYQNNGVAAHVSIKDKKVEVMVINSKEYYDQVKSPINDLIKDILKARNEEDYEVKVLNDPELYQNWRNMDTDEIEEEFNKVEAIVNQDLEKFGYKKGEIEIGLSSDKRINLGQVPKSENRIDEIKKQILASLKQENMGHYSIKKVYTYDPQLEDRGRLVTLSDTLAKGLTAKKEFNVDSVGSTNKYKDYFYIDIRTTFSKGDPDQIDFIIYIENTVKEFLTSKDALEIIKDDKYKVVIKSKDGEELETITN